MAIGQVILSLAIGLILGAAIGVAWVSRNDLRNLIKKNLCQEGYRLVRFGSHDPRTSIYRKIIWGSTLFV